MCVLVGFWCNLLAAAAMLIFLAAITVVRFKKDYIRKCLHFVPASVRGRYCILQVDYTEAVQKQLGSTIVSEEELVVDCTGSIFFSVLELLWPKSRMVCLH